MKKSSTKRQLGTQQPQKIVAQEPPPTTRTAQQKQKVALKNHETSSKKSNEKQTHEPITIPPQEPPIRHTSVAKNPTRHSSNSNSRQTQGPVNIPTREPPQNNQTNGPTANASSSSRQSLTNVVVPEATPVNDNYEVRMTQPRSVSSLELVEGTAIVDRETNNGQAGGRGTMQLSQESGKRGCSNRTLLYGILLLLILTGVAIAASVLVIQRKKNAAASTAPPEAIGALRKCVDTHEELVSAVQLASTSELQMVFCAGTTISIEDEVRIQGFNQVTLCCSSSSKGDGTNSPPTCDGSGTQTCTIQGPTSTTRVDMAGSVASRAMLRLDVRDSLQLVGLTVVMPRIVSSEEEASRNLTNALLASPMKDGSVHMVRSGVEAGEVLVKNCNFNGGVKFDGLGGNLYIAGMGGVGGDEGGVNATTTPSLTNVTIVNSTFREGFAEVGGAGLFVEMCHAVSIVNCALEGNQGGYGAGFAILDANSLVVSNSVFGGNIAVGRGGAGWFKLVPDGVEVVEADERYDAEIVSNSQSSVENVADVDCPQFYCAFNKVCVSLDGTMGR